MTTLNNIPSITDADYTRWCKVIQEKMNFCLQENQKDFLERRLKNRMSSLSIANYNDYYDAVIHDELNHEWEHLLELLVICESEFFRHPPSYKALQNQVLPELAKKKINNGQDTIAMWSAGSSRGQEPYSLAMCFYEFEEKAGRQNSELIPNTIEVQVFATDISRDALSRAQKGKYSLQELRSLPESLRNKYFSYVAKNEKRGSSSKLEAFKVNEKIRSKVRFQHMNLRHSETYFIPFQDVIFCQNVFVYFSKSDRAKIIYTFLNCLNPGGYLFVGPGESFGIEIDGVAVEQFEDTFAYKRKEEPVHVHVAE